MSAETPTRYLPDADSLPTHDGRVARALVETVVCEPDEFGDDGEFRAAADADGGDGLYAVQTVGGDTHRVDARAHRCDCKDYEHGVGDDDDPRLCKHLLAVAVRYPDEFEGVDTTGESGANADSDAASDTDDSRGWQRAYDPSPVEELEL